MQGYQPGWLTRLLSTGVALYLILPMLVVVPVSLTDQRFLSLPRENISFQYYENLFGSELWLASVGQSALIAVLSTLLALVVGTMCALGCWRLARRSSDLMRALVLLPLIVPTVVYAVGLYRMFARWGLLDSVLGVVLAHGVTALPYVMITVSASLASFDPRLEQAARGMGASLSQTLRWVIIPRILPGVFSGGIFAFIHSWDELLLVLFITSRRVFTLPRRIWNGINENLDPTMAAVAESWWHSRSR